MLDYREIEDFEDFNVGDRVRVDRYLKKTDELGNEMYFKGKTGTITDRTPSFVEVKFDGEDIFYAWEDGTKDYEIWFLPRQFNYEEQDK